MKFIILAAATAIGFSGAAIAGPTVMTDAQLDNIVAGEHTDTYYVFYNHGDNYAISQDGTPNNTGNGQGNSNARKWTTEPLDNFECSNDGSGTCSFDGTDFEWDGDDLEWG
jgi:hypothetical protein